jgi:hypothetical protein
MNDVEFIFLMFFMVVGGTCSIALFVQLLQCCLLRFCDKEEKVSVLQIRNVENPIVVPNISTGTISINMDEDPKPQI